MPKKIHNSKVHTMVIATFSIAIFFLLKSTIEIWPRYKIVESISDFTMEQALYPYRFENPYSEPDVKERFCEEVEITVYEYIDRDEYDSLIIDMNDTITSCQYRKPITENKYMCYTKEKVRIN